MADSMHADRGGTRRSGSTRTDEIVVSLPDRKLLRNLLGEWHADPYVHEDDLAPRLGLARVSFDAAAARRYLTQANSHLLRAENNRAVREQRTTNLDVVLGSVRQAFAEAYSGWVPVMGKNRPVERPGGAHVIAGGAPPNGDVGGSMVAGAHVIAGGGGGGGELIVTGAHVIAGGGQGAARPAGTTIVRPRKSTPGQGARVGVIDTKLFAHPWLAGSYLASSKSIYRSYPIDPPDAAQHATFVCGLIARQAPGSVIEHRKALDKDALGDSWTVAKTIAEFGAGEAQIINLSLGCTTEDSDPPLVLTAALETLGRGTLVVAAAGNHGNSGDDRPPPPSFPAAMPGVIAVGALDGARAAWFSPDAPWVDAMARGVDVASTCDIRVSGKSYYFGVWSGTSFAAALVAGRIAASLNGRPPRDAWEELADAARSRHPRRRRPEIDAARPKGWPRDRRP